MTETLLDEVNVLWTEWGHRIETARKAIPMTQVELAAELHVSQQLVSSWERGIAAPRDPMRVTVARILHRPAADLFPYEIAA